MGRDAPDAPGVIRLFLRMGGWIVLILGALLVLFSLIGQGVLATAERFETEGRVAEAEVIEKYTRESRDSDGDRRITYYFTVRFTTQTGEVIETTESVGSTRYREVPEGGRFELLYLESEPDRVEVNPGSNRTGAQVLRWVSLVIGLIWLGLLWVVGSWAVGAVRARRYGRMEEVRVTEIQRTNVKVNNRSRYRLLWRDAKGREGKSLMAPQSRFDGYSEGNIIMVYHGIRHMWWEEDVGRRAP